MDDQHTNLNVNHEYQCLSTMPHIMKFLPVSNCVQFHSLVFHLHVVVVVLFIFIRTKHRQELPSHQGLISLVPTKHECSENEEERKKKKKTCILYPCIFYFFCFL